MNSDLVARLARTGLQVIGSVLATKGYITEDMWTGVSGALLTLITTGFTVWASRKA